MKALPCLRGTLVGRLFPGLLLLCALPGLGQTIAIKENLGPAVNTEQDQILPVFSIDGQVLYFSENGANGRYEVWFSQLDSAGNWQPKQKAEGLNPPTNGSKYVFAQAEKDLLLVNGWFEQTGNDWLQSKGLSWYIPSEKRFVPLDIPNLQTQAKGRFVNAFLHRETKTLLLSYAENERKNLYVCQPVNPEAAWASLQWQAPVQLPTSLNSDFDDTTPFLDEDGVTLYFASNRPGGYGETDIYRSQRLGNSWTRWSPPENLGFSVNSNFSEIYYSVSPVRDFVHFVSYKYSYGSGDIFRFKTDSLQRAPAVVATALSPSLRDSVEVTPEPILDAEATELVELTPQSTLPAEDSDSMEVAEPVEVTELTVEEYKPNNLVFLIDRSGSMEHSDKLQMLKLSMKRLISQLRNIDHLTLISFADEAVIDFSTRGVTQKDSLFSLIDDFVADGVTKAHQGLRLAYDYTQEQFIDTGNNEIILVTDGQFDLSVEDRQRISANRGIVLSVVGLGTDPQALSNLRKLAARSNGSFINIRSTATATEMLLEEVKVRSRK